MNILLILLLFILYRIYHIFHENFKVNRRKRRRKKKRKKKKEKRLSKIPSEKKCAKILKSKGSSKKNIFDKKLDIDDSIDGLKDAASLEELKLKYKNYLKKECASNPNISNPERCDAAKVYYKQLKKFINDTKVNSENNSSSLRQLQDTRLSSGSYKDIYPINNYDFDYQTAMLKKYNVYKTGITNKPTGAALANSPKRIKKYMDVLIKREFPSKKTISGVTDTITDDDDMKYLKVKYDNLNKKLPYPSFRMDYPECNYPTKGTHSSSYFIRNGTCPTNITDQDTCEKKGYEWGNESTDSISKIKSLAGIADESQSQCNKPRFMYIDNSAKGYYGNKGLALSLFKDLDDMSPEKLNSIMDGYSVSGTGILPCIKDEDSEIVGVEDEYSTFYPDQDEIDLDQE